jgi:gamma-tubulin complex component 5
LEELPSTTAKLTPEILNLFLELSDQPLQKSRVEDLEKLVRPSEKRQLTWENIIGDEPLEGDIWEDVDFAAESSDAWSEDEDDSAGRLWLDEEPRKAKRQRKRKESLLAEDEEAYRIAGIDGFIVEGDKAGLDLLASAQYWNQRVPATDEEIDVSLGSNGGNFPLPPPMHLQPMFTHVSNRGHLDSIGTSSFARSHLHASRPLLCNIRSGPCTRERR